MKNSTKRDLRVLRVVDTQESDGLDDPRREARFFVPVVVRSCGFIQTCPENALVKKDLSTKRAPFRVYKDEVCAETARFAGDGKIDAFSSSSLPSM